MTYYGSFTPYLIRSLLADLSTNTLPPAITETFGATRMLRQTGIVVPANYASPIYWDLSSWTSINLVIFLNTGDTILECDWKTPWEDGTTSGAEKTFAYCPPDRSVVAPSAEPTNDIEGNGSVPGSVVIWNVHLTDPGEATIIVLGT